MLVMVNKTAACGCEVSVDIDVPTYLETIEPDDVTVDDVTIVTSCDTHGSVSPPELINQNQHCTADENTNPDDVCGYTMSHTAQWCGKPQPRRCGCAFCY